MQTCDNIIVRVGTDPGSGRFACKSDLVEGKIWNQSFFEATADFANYFDALELILFRSFSLSLPDAQSGQRVGKSKRTAL